MKAPYKLKHGDCLDLMSSIPDGMVDMVLCDLPFGTTKCSWDIIIPFEPLWEHYRRIVKPNGAIVLFAQTPFDKVLGCSNLPWLRYEWIWEKPAATGHLNAKKAPMKAHENILVFYGKPPTYNPQMTSGHKPTNFYTKKTSVSNKTEVYGKETKDISSGGFTDRYPRSVQLFSSDKQKTKLDGTIHPTQKPVALCEYLINTYTNEGDVVLDNCMGSGTTGVACVKTNRKFLGIEKDKKYFDVSKRRIEATFKDASSSLFRK